MTPRRLLILGVLAVVAIAVGLWVSYGSTSSGSAQLNAPLYPALEKELDRVTAVRIFKAGDTKAVELQRSDSGWTVAERSNYPADVAKLRKFVVDLAQAAVLEEKTSNPDNYATLGVEDVSKENATGLRVELEGVSTPVNLIVGKLAPGAKSHYVRRAGESQSWLVNRALDTSSTPDAWLRKEIIDVTADRIQSAAVTLKGAKRYVAAKSGRAAANFDIEGLPKGKELSAPTAANGFATALASLTLSDVQRADELAEQPADTAEFKTFDGLIVQLDGWKKDDKRYVAIKTSFDAEQAQRFHLPTETPKKDGEENKEGEASEASSTPSEEQLDKIRQEATSLQEKLAGWAYEIPSYKYDAIFKPLNDMLKD